MYRSGQDLSVSVGWDSQISRQSSHEVDKIVGLTHRPPLPQEMFLLLNPVDLRVIVRTEGLCQLKIPMAQSGIEQPPPGLERSVIYAVCYLEISLCHKELKKTAAIQRTKIDQLQSVVSDWRMKSVIDFGG